MFLCCRLRQNLESAVSRPHAPQLRLIIQARHDVTSAMSRMLVVGDAAMQFHIGTPTHGAGGGEADGAWKVRFEQEMEEYEDLHRKFLHDVRRKQDRAGPMASKVEALGTFADVRRGWCWAEACFASWCLWLVEEKCRRQFGQLSEDFDGFTQSRAEAAATSSQERAAFDLRAREREVDLQRRRARWKSLLGDADALLCQDVSNQLLRRVVYLWHIWAAKCASTRSLARDCFSAVLWAQVSVLLAVWKVEVGQRRTEEQSLLVETVRREVPQQTRRTAARHAAQVFDFQCEASLGSSTSVLISEAFTFWLHISRTQAREQRRCCIFERSLHRGLSLSLLDAFLLLWRSVSGQTVDVLAEKRLTGQRAVSLQKRCAGRTLVVALDVRLAVFALASLQCWQTMVKHSKLAHDLEAAYSEQQLGTAGCREAEVELKTLQEAWQQEEGTWHKDGEDLAQVLQNIREEQEAAAKAFQEVASEEQDLESSNNAAVDRTAALAKEMLRMEAQLTGIVEQLRLAEAREADVAASMRDQEATLQEELSELQQASQPMQTEAARHRDRRQTDVKTARHQARSSVVSQEERRMHLSVAHEQDQASWGQKLRQSEGKIGRLEGEIQQARADLREHPAKVLAFEEEVERLLREAEEAERLVEEAEARERARRQQLHSLRGAYEELKSTQVILERQLVA
mmetsp:Transcript_167076/g.531413  ORF Transcript_167076/g.531413 Transcript_167076/m.531413 type:complete len:685 (+) Transcript_167076:104-2158(+)